ncbi:MAG: YkgJ family cysteine cluster protein [Armatimonadota bacterium]|nr:YkgJ family cysteine cluster protein [Armatimonadota bacterium]
MQLSEDLLLAGDSQSGSSQYQQEAAAPTEAREKGDYPLPLAVLSPKSQQDSESFCENLPLEICHGCDGCGLRCTEGVRMTRIEFLRIEHFIQAHPEEMARVQTQDKSIPDWPVTKFCQFRDTEGARCSIYPVRPVICRLFGHTEWLPCPLGIVPLQGQRAMDVYQQYAKEESRTFDEWCRLLPAFQQTPASEQGTETP